MGADRIAQTQEFVEALSRSTRAILLKRFPGLASQDLEDIEQEVKLKIWKMAASGKNIRHFRSYLWKAVYTTALDVLDGRLERLPAGLEGAGEEPHSSAESMDRTLTIREAIEALPLRRRQVVNLHLEGLDLEASARRLGWSKNRVRHLFYRARADLKEKLSNAAHPAAPLQADADDE